MSNPAQSLPPGFRFHPTDEELILHYLRNRAASTPCPVSIIAEVDIYKFDPWDLPEKAMFGDREWYFFSPRDRKYPNGIRPNRAAASGYWKATGTDKPIHASTIGNENIGVKKALVFYKGRPPKGQKTNWIMHEYRLAEASPSNCYRPMKLRDTSMRLDDWVLCRIYKKSSSMQTVEPSMIVAEAEDSGAEDPYASTSQNIPLVPESSLKLQKSFSVSEFLEDYSALSHLFDNLPETPTMDNSKQPFVNSSRGNANDINYLVHQLSQGGSSASLAGNYMKRQRPVDEGVVTPPKKRNDSCNFTSFAIGNQLDLPQYNMMSQLLLNSHLGLH